MIAHRYSKSMLKISQHRKRDVKMIVQCKPTLHRLPQKLL